MPPSKKSTKGRKSGHGHSKGKSSASSTKPDPSTQQNQSEANSQHGYSTVSRDWPTSQRSWSHIEDQAQSSNAGNSTTTDRVTGIDSPGTGELSPMERFAQETPREGTWNNVDAVAYGNVEEGLDDYEIVGGSTDAATW